MDFEQINRLSDLCHQVMRRDQYRLQQRIQNLKTKVKKKQPIDTKTVETLITDIENAYQHRQQRLAQLPIPQFPNDLPVSERREDIAAAISKHQVVIIAGETGSGKTTQLPKICLTAGRGVNGMIGCTQPRRIAARTIAARIASELKTTVGHTVGYKVRFSDHVSEHSYIKLMTDGILLAETQGDRFLEQYDTLIIDEAHERSLNIDFLLGYLKRLLPKRPDLKVIITSATIDTQRFSAHFDHAPIIEVSGRTYPVEVRYRPLGHHDEDEQDRDMQQAIIDAVDEINQYERQADILVFLSGERDIRETADNLHKHRLLNTEILPLYAKLSTTEQNRVFSPENARRIILATNVAETSLTVPRIRAVIDTGLARISRYSVRSKVQHLPIEKISRSSAEQRKGRCGRIAPGLCIRLYSENDFNDRPEFTEPEILRTSLAAVILQMLSLQLGDIGQFPFVEPPTPKMINSGFALLAELGAIDEKRRLTQIGRQLAKLPIDPRLGRMILAAKQEQCLQEVLIIASALSIQDPRERPMDKQAAADAAQTIFTDEHSDFLSFLKLWRFFQEKSQHLSKNKLRQLCHDHFLSYVRMREWIDIHHQLTILIKELGWKINEINAEYLQIHRALLSGLLGNIAFKLQKAEKTEPYLGTRGLKLNIFPGSTLFKKMPKWVVAAELVETSKLYARTVAKIEPEWVEQVAGDLCQRTYFEPHWEKRVAEVAAYEKVTLYGLTIEPKRKVNYGSINPIEAREIFIRYALVQGEYYCRAPFFEHNQKLIGEIEALEHKARRQDILVDEEQLFVFYNDRIPQGIYNGTTFEQWLKQIGENNPLFLTREDLMLHQGESITKHAFPDFLLVNEVQLPLTYHFEPGSERDGVTIKIPLTLLNQLSEHTFEWLVPGLLEEKIIALLRSLPKNVRKSFVPIPDVAKEALQNLPTSQVTFQEGGSFLVVPQISLYDALARFCHRYRGVPLPEPTWDFDSLPTHLCMNFLLIDQQHELVEMGRNLTELQRKWGKQATVECRQEIAKTTEFERTQLTHWDFGDLPTMIDLVINKVKVQGFPTLVDCTTHVDLRILDNQENAQQSFISGLRRLFWLNLPVKRLLKQMPIDHKLCLQYMKVGDCETLKEELLTAVIDTAFLFSPLPTKQVEFEQRLQQGKQQMMTIANEYSQLLAIILEEYFKTVQQVNQTTALPTDITIQLADLVYQGFIQEIPLEQLRHISRYLKAIQLRLDKLVRDPNKDKQKMAQLVPFWETYLNCRAKLTQRNAQWYEFRWTLEELRVSLFAQELRTAYPISVKKMEKLEKNWQNC